MGDGPDHSRAQICSTDLSGCHPVAPLCGRLFRCLGDQSAAPAKRMRFQSRWPMDEYETMFQKVTTALTCPPDRFGETFDYSEDLGQYLL